jgi:hypothetical protein
MHSNGVGFRRKMGKNDVRMCKCADVSGMCRMQMGKMPGGCATMQEIAACLGI